MNLGRPKEMRRMLVRAALFIFQARSPGQGQYDDHHAVVDLQEGLDCDEKTAKRLLRRLIAEYPGVKHQIYYTEGCLR